VVLLSDASPRTDSAACQAIYGLHNHVRDGQTDNWARCEELSPGEGRLQSSPQGRNDVGSQCGYFEVRHRAEPPCLKTGLDSWKACENDARNKHPLAPKFRKNLKSRDVRQSEIQKYRVMRAVARQRNTGGPI
jgi:hypothetical protein